MSRCRSPKRRTWTTHDVTEDRQHTHPGHMYVRTDMMGRFDVVYPATAIREVSCCSSPVVGVGVTLRNRVFKDERVCASGRISGGNDESLSIGGGWVGKWVAESACDV